MRVRSLPGQLLGIVGHHPESAPLGPRPVAIHVHYRRFKVVILVARGRTPGSQSLVASSSNLRNGRREKRQLTSGTKPPRSPAGPGRGCPEYGYSGSRIGLPPQLLRGVSACHFSIVLRPRRGNGCYG